jgi:L-glyceraldehyde 3-phosphate reductase
MGIWVQGNTETIVSQGKALYIGISSYPAADTEKAIAVLQALGMPLLIHQPKYSLLERWVEGGLLELLDKNGVGCISFSSLAQGLLTNKYLSGIPADSRAASNRGNGAIDSTVLTDENLSRVKKLDVLAGKRGQTLAQMSLAWVLRDRRITSVIIGASKPEQILDSLGCLRSLSFAPEELQAIEQILK